MKRLPVILVLISVLMGPQVRAQVAERADSTALQTASALRVPSFKATQLIAPGALAVAGIGVHTFLHKEVDIPIRDAALDLGQKWGPVPYYDYLRYLPAVPLALDLGLGLTGVKVEHRFLDRAVEAGIACAVAGGTAFLLKQLIYSPRPDKVSNDSFPSGHTCTAFVGAELVRLEYGWGWGAGAYVLATGVALLRVYHNRHWFSDLLFGAGIGILGAHVGRWLLDPVHDVLGMDNWFGGKAVQASLTPYVDPLSGTFCAGLAFAF